MTTDSNDFDLEIISLGVSDSVGVPDIDVRSGGHCNGTSGQVCRIPRHIAISGGVRGRHIVRRCPHGE